MRLTRHSRRGPSARAFLARANPGPGPASSTHSFIQLYGQGNRVASHFNPPQHNTGAINSANIELCHAHRQHKYDTNTLLPDRHQTIPLPGNAQHDSISQRAALTTIITMATIPPQAYSSSYAPRLRQYNNSLFAPATLPLSSGPTGTRTSKRGTQVNYSEDVYDDDDFDTDTPGRRPTGLRSLRRDDSTAAAAGGEKEGLALGTEIEEPVVMQPIHREWMVRKPAKPAYVYSHLRTCYRCAVARNSISTRLVMLT